MEALLHFWSFLSDCVYKLFSTFNDLAPLSCESNEQHEIQDGIKLGYRYGPNLESTQAENRS